MKKAQPVALASLVEDFSLYPRHTVSDSHILDLVRALQSGITLPPIIAERKSKRVVDGVHRRRALLKHFGEDAVTPVELRDYENDAALFLDAVDLNSAHGRKLDRHDQTRIVLRLRELHVPDQQIALRLHVPEPTITQLAIRVVIAPSGEQLPSKRGLEHMRGTTLTDAQVSVMGSVRSAEAGRLCLELTRLLSAEMVDLRDEQIRARLIELERAIQSALQIVAA